MRPAVAAAALGLALAVGTPTVWAVTQPAATAGAPLSEALPPAPSAPSLPPVPAPPAAPSTTVAPAPDLFPELGTFDGSPQVVVEPPAPQRLSIPALGVDAPVDAMGVAADGQMELPEDVSRVAWYRFGPHPGEAGSSVIAGHVDDREQGLGELAPLRLAEVGDEVVVTDETGAATRWRVVSREVITKSVLPVDRIFSREGPPRLTLVTCGGPFLPEYRSYRDNVVVVAEPVASSPRNGGG